MSDTLTLAFAGSGKTTEANIHELLNDFIGAGKDGLDEYGYYTPSDKVIELMFPLTAEHWNETLQMVLDWSEKADLPYWVINIHEASLSAELETILEEAEGHSAIPVTPADQLGFNEVFIDQLYRYDNTYLVLAWGDEPDENCQELLDIADQHEITVLDLTGGLDEIVYAADDTEVESVGDESALAPQPKDKPKAKVEEPLEDAEKPLEETDDVTSPDHPDYVPYQANPDEAPTKGGSFAKRARKAREDAADEAQTLIKPNSDHLNKTVGGEAADSLAVILERLGKVEARLTALEKG